jgi:predicted nucleic acid-binding protein
VRTWLLDTGPLVAYLDANDAAHHKVSSCIDSFSGALATTGAVVTEAMYFVSSAARGPSALAAFAAASGMRIYDLSQPPELKAAADLTERYADTPMDYADASLVLLAEALGVREILTLDRRGFSTYRTRRRHAFTLVLDSAGERSRGGSILEK